MKKIVISYSLLALVLFAAIFLYGVPFVDSDTLSFTPFYQRSGFPEIKNQDFSTSVMFPVVVSSDRDLFDSDVLAHIRRFSSALKNVNGVSGVISLTDAKILAGEDDTLEVRTMDPEAKDAFTELRQYRDLYEDILYNQERDHSLILVSLYNNVDFQEYWAVVRDVQRLIHLHKNADCDFVLHGYPAMATSVVAVAAKDCMHFLLLSTLLALLLFFLGEHTLFIRIVRALAAFVLLSALLLGLHGCILFCYLLIPLVVVYSLWGGEKRPVLYFVRYSGLRLLMAGGVLLLVGCSVFAAYTRFSSIFVNDKLIAHADKEMDTSLTGTDLLDVTIAAPGIASPEFMSFLDTMKQHITRIGAGKVIIMSDFIKMMNRAFFYGDENYYGIPNSGALYQGYDVNGLISQYLFLYQGVLDEFAAPDIISPKRIRFLVLMKSGDRENNDAVIHYIEHAALQHDYTMHVGGSYVMEKTLNIWIKIFSFVMALVGVVMLVRKGTLVTFSYSALLAVLLLFFTNNAGIGAALIAAFCCVLAGDLLHDKKNILLLSVPFTFVCSGFSFFCLGGGAALLVGVPCIAFRVYKKYSVAPEK